MADKKYRVMAILIEEADSSIIMKDDYIPIGVVYTKEGPHVSVLVPCEEVPEPTNDIKPASELKGVTDAE